MDRFRLNLRLSTLRQTPRPLFSMSTTSLYPSCVFGGMYLGYGDYVDMVKAGIIDPTNVVRLTLQGVASIAALLITTEAMVAETPEAAPAMSRGGWAVAWISNHPLHRTRERPQKQPSPSQLFGRSPCGRCEERRRGARAGT
jgi:hypothetical protein